MTLPSGRLHVEALEDRVVPTLFGVPWADQSRITISFVPDGTALPGAAGSDLFETMNAVAPTAVWQGEVLRAFQTWASQAGLGMNFAVVADSGEPLGTTGAPQADSSFGDIRIASMPRGLSSGLASASPFSWTGTTLSGDVLFNSTMPFGIGNDPNAYDIFSVTLHEAGHTLGLDHCEEAGSAIQEDYHFATRLGGDDVSHVQELYASRTADSFDAARSNGSLSTATTLKTSSLLSTQIVTHADITTTGDQDYYKVTAPLLAGLTGISFRVKASGISLLTPTVTVFNAAGQVLKTATTTDSTKNDVGLLLTGVSIGATYYVRVDGGPADAFSIGAYRLTVDYLLFGALPPAEAPVLVIPAIDLHTNDSLNSATPLSGQSASADSRFDVALPAQITDIFDTDYYRVKVPAGATNMVVMVWGIDTLGLNVLNLNPRIRLYDANQNPLAFQVLSNDDGLMSVQVPNLAAGSSVYVQVSARETGLLKSLGSYYVAVDFGQKPPMTFDPVAANTLTQSKQTDSGILQMAGGQMMHFNLSASTANANADGAVTMTILDANGNVVAKLTARTGQPAVTRSLYLGAGAYTVKYSASGDNGWNDLRYNLSTYVITDDVGPYSTTQSGGTPPSGGYEYGGNSDQTASSGQYWF